MMKSSLSLLRWSSRSFLTPMNSPGDETPIIRGSALKALECDDLEADEAKPIFELLDTLDSYVPEPERDTAKPFLMPIEDVFFNFRAWYSCYWSY